MSNTAKARILYVDDLEDWRKQVGDLLRDYGYEVVTVSSASEAKRFLREEVPFDLAIVDMRLVDDDESDRSGVNLAIHIRREKPDLPIIILTAYSHFMPTQEALKISRFPYAFPTVEKGDIKSEGDEGLFFQMEALLHWSQRPIYCFVIMPFAEPFDDVYKAIKTTLEKLSIDCLRADEDTRAGNIPSRIRQHLKQRNTFIVADLSGLNPNVCYELGYAYALGKPTILLRQDQEYFPAISTQQMIRYNTMFSGIEALGGELEASITQTLDDPDSRATPRVAAQQASQTYAAFIPDTEIGQLARSEVVSSVVARLGLQPQATRVAGATVQATEEVLQNIQRAAVIIGEISEGDPMTYFYVGASDALKKRGIVLLIRSGSIPPFNLQGRANTIEYDPSTRRTALEAQVELEDRIKASLAPEPVSTDMKMPEHLKIKLQERQIVLYEAVKRYRDQALDKINIRLKDSDEVDEMRKSINQWAERFHLAVGNANTLERLEEITRDLEESGPKWHDNAARGVSIHPLSDS